MRDNGEGVEESPVELPRYLPPADLAERVRAVLEAERQVMPGEHASRPWRRAAIAAAVVLAVAGTGVIGYWRGTKVNESDDPLVASHVRSLLGDHLTDVASSDRHTVKPWLDARLDYAPPVIDLAADSLPLIGGRLDYLSHRPVAVLVYQRRRHIINVYIAPAGALAAGLGRGALERGYHVMRWRTGGMDAVSISDVEPKELTRFSELFQQRVAAADVDLP